MIPAALAAPLAALSLAAAPVPQPPLEGWVWVGVENGVAGAVDISGQTPGGPSTYRSVLIGALTRADGRDYVILENTLDCAEGLSRVTAAAFYGPDGDPLPSALPSDALQGLVPRDLQMPMMREACAYTVDGTRDVYHQLGSLLNVARLTANAWEKVAETDDQVLGVNIAGVTAWTPEVDLLLVNRRPAAGGASHIVFRHRMDCEARSLEPLSVQSFGVDDDALRADATTRLSPAMSAAALERLCRREPDLDTDVLGFVETVRPRR